MSGQRDYFDRFALVTHRFFNDLLSIERVITVSSDEYYIHRHLFRLDLLILQGVSSRGINRTFFDVLIRFV